MHLSIFAVIAPVALGVATWGFSALASISEPLAKDLQALAAKPEVTMKDEGCQVRGALWDTSTGQPIKGSTVNLLHMVEGVETGVSRGFADNYGRFSIQIPRGTVTQVQYRTADGDWTRGAYAVCLAKNWEA